MPALVAAGVDIAGVRRVGDRTRGEANALADVGSEVLIGGSSRLIALGTARWDK
jgi:hypothetical protein